MIASIMRRRSACAPPLGNAGRKRTYACPLRRGARADRLPYGTVGKRDVYAGSISIFVFFLRRDFPAVPVRCVPTGFLSSPACARTKFFLTSFCFFDIIFLRFIHFGVKHRQKGRKIPTPTGENDARDVLPPHFFKNFRIGRKFTKKHLTRRILRDMMYSVKGGMRWTLN